MFLKLTNKPFKEQLSPWILKTFRESVDTSL